MKALVLSDIHGNLEALDAVLADAPASAHDVVICLGDLVGYGASPAEVMNRVWALNPTHQIRGNHDRVCARLTSAQTFSPAARLAIEWTQRVLSADDMSRLTTLPIGPVSIAPDIVICHGAPHDEDFYILDTSDARLTFVTATFRLCLHGHTHAQTVFRLTGQSLFDETPLGRSRSKVALHGDSRWLVNPGSVGQPRDGDARAGYALLDTDAWTVELRRVPYDVAAAQRKIRAAGLPAHLASRLATGE